MSTTKPTTPKPGVKGKKPKAGKSDRVLRSRGATPVATAAPANSKKATSVTAVTAKKAAAADASALTLTEEELEFIMQARRDGKKAADYKKATPQGKTASNEKVASAGVHPEEAAYAGISGDNTILNEVHAHCLGIVKLDALQLRKQATTALAKVKTWEMIPGAKDKVRAGIIKALPVLGKELLKIEGLPAPKSFSADKVVETYKEILTRYLSLTKCLVPKQKKKVRYEDEEGESGDSSDEGDKVVTKSSKLKKEITKHTREVERALRIAEESYPESHLYECERMLKAYKQWRDPRDPSERKATIPKDVRSFVSKHLADDAPVMTAYDQKHVKSSQGEQKHVTFLLNEMGYLASRVCKERLSRAGKELSRDGRIRKGHALSKKEREESIKGERELAARVRWFGDLLGEGIAGWEAYKKGRKAKATQSNLLASGEFSATEAQRVAKSVVKSGPRSRRSRSRSRSRGRSRGGRRGRYSRTRRDNDRSRDRDRRDRDRFRRGDRNPKGEGKGPRCWHCNEHGHQASNCPSMKAGKPPHAKSRFGKARAKKDGGD